MPPPSSKDDDPQSGQGRPLPKKEADLFKNVIKFYESKQLKKAIKNADLILKRYPNHGETLCMKGLIVNAMANSGLVGVDSLKGDKNKKSGGSGDSSNEKEDLKSSVAEKKKEAIELVKLGLMKDMRYVFIICMRPIVVCFYCCCVLCAVFVLLCGHRCVLCLFYGLLSFSIY